MTRTRYTSIACAMVLAMMAFVSTACNNTVTITGPGLESSLIHYYPFGDDPPEDHGSDPTNVDVQGPVLATGKDLEINTAYDFDGNDDYIALDYFTLPETSTISAWIRTTNTDGQILRWRYDTGGPGAPIEIFGISDHELVYSKTSAMNDSITSSTAVNTNRWVHVVLVKENTNAKLYIDGSLDTEDDVDVSLSGMNELRIGTGFSGTIDEIRIYNKALTADEVASVYEM